MKKLLAGVLALLLLLSAAVPSCADDQDRAISFLQSMFGQAGYEAYATLETIEGVQNETLYVIYWVAPAEMVTDAANTLQGDFTAAVSWRAWKQQIERITVALVNSLAAFGLPQHSIGLYVGELNPLNPDVDSDQVAPFYCLLYNIADGNRFVAIDEITHDIGLRTD